MFRFYQKNSSLIHAIILFFTSLTVFLNVRFFDLPVLSPICLLLFLFFSSLGFGGFLSNKFFLENSFRLKMLGGLLSVFILSALSGLFVIFWRFDSIQIFIVFLLTGLISIFLGCFRAQPFAEDEEENRPLAELVDGRAYKITFFVLLLVGFWCLWRVSGIGDSALSPWQIVYSGYVYIFFLAALVVGGLLFGKTSIRFSFFFLFLFFVLAFSLLPLSHKYFWGADGWRHAASVEQIIENGKLSVQNFSDSSNWLEKLNPGLYSYSEFWGLLTLTQKTTGLELFSIIAWLQPILAILFFPILFFELALILGFGKRESLIFSWLALFPFALQAAGGFSLPVNLGFLFFLFFLVLLLRRLKKSWPGQLPFLTLVGVLSLFGYALYALLFFVFWIMTEIYLRYKMKNENKKFSPLVWSAAVFALLLPLIELLAGSAKFNGWASLLSGLKKLFGGFSGYYLASGPRPHVIDFANVFFNQIPSHAFAENGFTAWRWWIPVIMVLFFTGIFFGWKKLWRAGGEKKVFVLFASALFVGHVVSRFFLTADNLLTRRMDAVLALTLLMIFFAALVRLFKNPPLCALFVFVIAAAMTASYSLGPYSQAMSEDEYKAAEYVYSRVQKTAQPCVVADLYPLLALEAFSKKQIVGGGFPIDENFGQPGLIGLYKDFEQGRGERARAEAKKIIDAEWCYLIAPKEAPVDFEAMAKFGNQVVYRF